MKIQASKCQNPMVVDECVRGAVAADPIVSGTKKCDMAVQARLA